MCRRNFMLMIALWMVFTSSLTFAEPTQPVSQLHNNATQANASDAALAAMAEGQAAFNDHNYEKAFKLWLGLAQQGNTEAQVFVGLAYKNGWGVERDVRKESMWFQMAAEGGNPSAQFFLGLHYVNSDNPAMVPVGVNWLLQAAKHGETNARNFLVKARQRQWFSVPDTLDSSARVTQVTAKNIDQVFAGASPSAEKAEHIPQ